MALGKDTMTDEQRKSVALEYLKAFDNAGVTSTSGSILDLFARSVSSGSASRQPVVVPTRRMRSSSHSRPAPGADDGCA